MSTDELDLQNETDDPYTIDANVLLETIRALNPEVYEIAVLRIQNARLDHEVSNLKTVNEALRKGSQ